MAGKSNNFEVGFVFGAKKASTFDNTVKGVIKGIAGIATAYVSINTLKGAVDTFATFEQSMANVQAISGATVEEFTALEAAALDMGRKTSKTAAESADALSYMALAGWDAEQSIAGLEPILRASEAFSADLATTSDLVTDSMAAMGIEVQELGGYLDVVAKAQASANANGQQMMEAYLNVGGKLKDMNADMSESAAILGLMANRGEKGSAAGNSLNTILMRMTASTGESSKAMQALGISAFDTQGNWRPLEDIFMDVHKALEGMDDQQQAYYKDMIAGKNHSENFSKIMAGLSEEYMDLKAEIQACDGALLDQAETINATMQGAFKRLESATDDMKIMFVKTFEKELTGAIDFVAEYIPVVTEKMTQGIQWIGSKAAPVFASIKENGAAAIQYIKNKWDQHGPSVISFFTKARDKADTAFAWVKDTAVSAFGTIQAKMVEVTPKIKNVGAAIWDLGTKVYNTLSSGFEKAKPVISWVAITGLPLLIGALTNTLSFAADVYQCFSNNWSWIKPIVIGIGAAFAAWKTVDVLGRSVEGVLNFSAAIVKLPPKIAAATTAQLAHVKSKIADKVQTLQLCALYAKDFAVALVQNVKSVAASTAAWVANKAIMIGTKVATLALKAAQVISTGATAAMTAAQWALNAAFIASPIGWVVLAIGGLIAAGVLLYKNWDKIRGMAGKVWSSMKSTFGNAVSFFQGIWSGATAIFEKFVSGLAEKCPFLYNIFSVQIDAIKGAVAGLKVTFGGIVDFVAGTFTGDWSRAWTGVQNIFSGIFQSFSALAKQPINAVIAIINRVIGGINGMNIEIPDWVPFGLGGKTFGLNIPEITPLATGGVVTAPTLSLIGEGSEPEAVMPLSKLSGMLNDPMGAITSLVQKFLSVMEGTGEDHLPPINFAPKLVFNGPADEREVQNAMSAAYTEFEKWMKRYEQERKRKSLK